MNVRHSIIICQRSKIINASNKWFNLKYVPPEKNMIQQYLLLIRNYYFNSSSNCDCLSHRMTLYIIWPIFSFVFQLSGLALLSLGLLTRYYSTKTEELANRASGDATGLAALAFIIIGGAVFIVSFFGCCGAIRESHCMITMVSNFRVTHFARFNVLFLQECRRLLRRQCI